LHRDPGLLARTWRRPVHSGRVASPQAPTPDRESLQATIAQSSWDRILAGWMAIFIRPTRLLRSAIVLVIASIKTFSIFAATSIRFSIAGPLTEMRTK
jgi:hypothetical protein